jgi:uncharacterized protein YlxP (DUF503 family)
MIGVLTLQIIYPQVLSLKEKRSIIQSLFTKVRKTFNVAIAEIKFQDLWQKSEVGVVTINSSTIHLQRTLDYVVNFISEGADLQIIDYQVEIL